jgi:hypothetical protein
MPHPEICPDIMDDWADLGRLERLVRMGRKPAALANR